MMALVATTRPRLNSTAAKPRVCGGSGRVGEGVEVDLGQFGVERLRCDVQVFGGVDAEPVGRPRG